MLSKDVVFDEWLNGRSIRCDELFARAAGGLEGRLTPERAASIEWYRRAERLGEHLGESRGDLLPYVRNLHFVQGPFRETVQTFFLRQTRVPMFRDRAHIALFLFSYSAAQGTAELEPLRIARLIDSAWWFADLNVLSVIARLEGPASIGTFLEAAKQTGDARLFSLPLERLTGQALGTDTRSYLSRVGAWYEAAGSSLSLDPTSTYSGAAGSKPLFTPGC